MPRSFDSLCQSARSVLRPAFDESVRKRNLVGNRQDAFDVDDRLRAALADAFDNVGVGFSRLVCTAALKNIVHSGHQKHSFRMQRINAINTQQYGCDIIASVS